MTPIKQKLNTLIHSRTNDFFVIIISLFSLVILIIELALLPSASTVATLQQTDLIVTWILLAEFFLSWFTAKSGKGYFIRHWPDLLGSIPITDTALRSLRVLRLLRLGRLFRLLRFQNATILSTWFRNQLAFPRLVILATIVILSCGIGFYLTERGVQPYITHLSDGFTWATTTFLTLGYSQPPLTIPGQLFGLILIALSISILGIVLGLVTQKITNHFTASHSPNAQSQDYPNLR